MIINDVFWLSKSFGTSFIHFHALDYYFGSLREDIPQRAKFVKMAKIKVCKSSCIFRNMYGGPLNDPPCPLSVKLAKIMIYHVVKMGFMR